MCVYVTESYMLNRVFTKRLCVRDRERCVGLEVGRGRVRGVKMCALMHVLHAIVRGTDESREMVVVLRMLLSHSHTHK